MAKAKARKSNSSSIGKLMKGRGIAPVKKYRNKNGSKPWPKSGNVS